MIALKDILVKPIQTEKSVAAEAKGKYSFLVHPQATKPLVKKALKEFYGATAGNVNISTLPEKTRLIGRGRMLKRRRDLKKAVVTLSGKKKLDFNAFK